MSVQDQQITCHVTSCRTCCLLDYLYLQFVTWMTVISVYSRRDEGVLYHTRLSLAYLTVYCIKLSLLLCLPWCRLEVYPTTFLSNLSSSSWGVNWIEPSRVWSRKIDKTMRTAPGEFFSIGDSGFPVYSSITTSVSVEVFRSGKGYVGGRNLA